MDTNRFSLERSAIRFEIDGSWTCEEFSDFLKMTEDVYSRINSIFVLRDAIDEESRQNRDHQESQQYDRMDFSWHNQFFGASYNHPMGSIGTEPPKYSRLIELISSVTEPLQIDAISYASPGWIQMIGNWNPLKVLADLLSKWRAENTKREANRLKAQTERLRIQAELAATILENAPKMERQYRGVTSRLIDLAEEVISPTTTYIETIGSNSRVIAAEIVSAGQALPSPQP